MQNNKGKVTFSPNDTSSSINQPGKRVFYFVALAVGFICVAIMHEYLITQDIQFERWIYSFTTNDNYYIYSKITLLGEAFLLVPITLLIILGFLLRKQWQLAAGLAMSVAGGGVVTLILKFLFRSNRPDQINDLNVRMNYGFPSGHAVMSIIFWGFLIYVLMKNIQHKKMRWVIEIFAVVIPLVVGLTRLFLGVHYPTDILAGWILGSMWLGFTISTMTFFDKALNRLAAPNHDSGINPILKN